MISATAIFNLFAANHQRIEGIGRASGFVVRVHQHIQKKSFTPVPSAASIMSLTTPTVRAAWPPAKLQIIREIIGDSYSAFIRAANFAISNGRSGGAEQNSASDIGGGSYSLDSLHALC